jgi:hypothetical protein
VANGQLEADQSREMTTEQMIHHAKRAEQLHKRLTEVEQEREATGLYEEALEARRLRLEHDAAALYWRSRASGGAP